MARGGNTVVARVGLDDKGFQEGVTKIQRSLKVVKSEFAAASSKLKDFGKSTEGLKLKSDSLSKQMELQKQKVAALTKSYQESVEKKGEDAKATENLKVRLNYATAEMNKLQHELNETNERIRVQESRWTQLGNKLNEAGTKMQTVGKKMQDVGKSLSTKVTAPIVGVGTAAAKMSIDFEDSLAKVSTIVDTTQLSMENVKKGVLNLSNETGEGVNDLNESLYQSISAGVESGKSIEFLGSAVKLAKGGFTETSSSVDLLTTILNGYKLKAEETANVSDILINTQNLGKTSVNELSSSMGKVVPIASAANVNLKQLSSAYVLLTQKGIATAEAGTYTRSMLSELSKTGSTADKTLRQISGKSFAELMASGKSVGDVLNMLNEYANKNNLTLKDMFGSVEAGTASMILAGAGGQDFNKVLDTMSNVAGATDTAFNKVNETTGARLKKSFNSLKNAGIQLGDSLAPMIEKVSGAIQILAEKFNNLTPAQADMIVKIGLMVAALGPAISIIGKLISTGGTLFSTLGKVSTALGEAGGAGAVLGKAFAALKSPIGIAVIAIGTIITIGVALYKNWDTIKAKAAELKKAISEKWNEIKQVTTAVFTSIKDFLNNIWNGIKSVFTNSLNTIKSGVTSGWNGIKNITTTVWNSIKTIIANVWNGIKSVVTSSVNGVKNIVASIWNSIKNVTTSVWNGIKTAITTPINSARDIVKKAVDSIYGFFKNLRIPEIKIPKIKLPHFSLRGEFSLMPPKVPKFDVNWYAQGGIFNAPSIIGVGEAGTEAVLPIDRLDEIIAKSIKKAQGLGETNGLTVHIEKFINNTEKDIEWLAYELEFYRQRISMGKGGN